METGLPVLTEKHHALLFALIARETLGSLGVLKGEAVIAMAVRRYGEQRGRRMALRARRDNQALTMSNYMIYGEWRSLTGDIDQKLQVDGEDLRMRVPRCPWANAWVDADLLPYGRLYCREIDIALLRGFNPDLILQVNSTQTNDDEACDFVFLQGLRSEGDTLAYIQGNSARLKELNSLPWEYHCGHLLAACTQVLVDEAGLAGRTAVEAALAEFGQRFSEQAAEQIAAYQNVDFERLPG
jgi:hypothetical protein